MATATVSLPLPPPQPHLNILRDENDDGSSEDFLLLPARPPTPPTVYPTALVPPLPHPPYEPWKDPRYALAPMPTAAPHVTQVPSAGTSSVNAPSFSAQTPAVRSGAAHEMTQMMTGTSLAQQLNYPALALSHLGGLTMPPLQQNYYSTANPISVPPTQYQLHQQPALQQAPFYPTTLAGHPQHANPQLHAYTSMPYTTQTPYAQQQFMHPAVSVPAFNPSNFPIPIRRGYSRGNSNNYTTGGNSPGNFGTFGSNPTPSRRGAPSLPARQLASFNPPREGIYEATYSNTRVYELEAPNGVGVMRRKSDSWINATHILKAAGMEKSRRTKVLEREVHQGEHEKIQGGYGKYQGTWIPLYRAREVAADYGLADALHDLLDIPE